MTQFRLYDSPQSFVYDSPQSFLHGVTQAAACFPLTWNNWPAGTAGSANPFQWFQQVNWYTIPDISHCSITGAPAPPGELRGATHTTNITGELRDFRTASYSLNSFNHTFDSGGAPGSFIFPSQIPINIIIIGVESGTQITFSDAPRNTVSRSTVQTFGCLRYGEGTQQLNLTITNPGPVYTRAQVIVYEVFPGDTGNALAGQVSQIWYGDNLYGPDPITPVPDPSDQVDWEASGYFLPGEECYFEGCPPPYYPTPYTSTFNATTVSHGFTFTTKTCSGSDLEMFTPADFIQQQNAGAYNLAGNTVSFDWADALVVRADGGGSFAFPGCEVAATFPPSNEPGRASGFGGGYWSTGFDLNRGTSNIYTGQYGASSRAKTDNINNKTPWDTSTSGPLDVYLWFPGAPAA